MNASDPVAETVDLEALRRQLSSVGSGAAEPDLASSPFKDINGALEELRRLNEAYDDLCDGSASPCPHIGVDLAQVLLGEVIRQAAELDRYRELRDAAKAWRAMRADTPTRPKPESAALIAAVDALEMSR